jgi:regulator of RNase E activity RraB
MISAITRALIMIVLFALAVAGAADVRAQADEDADAIAELRAEGVDLNQPQTIDFAFLFPDLESAERLAPKLQAKGFQTRIRPAGGGQDYLLYARMQILITRDAMAEWRRQFEAMAKAENGEYDGWGSPSTQ